MVFKARCRESVGAESLGFLIALTWNGLGLFSYAVLVVAYARLRPAETQSPDIGVHADLASCSSSTRDEDCATMEPYCHG